LNKWKVSKENQKLTVGGGSGALLGSSGGLLATSGALLHVHVHATSGFGFCSESLGGLLVDAESLLYGIVGVVEEASYGLAFDLGDGMSVRTVVK
jgi:hypothetical protein